MEASAAATYPAGHMMHLERSSDEVVATGVTVQSAQALYAVAESADWNFPAEHNAQAVLRSSANFPKEHDLQAAKAGATVSSWYWPCPQLEHIVVEFDVDWPRAHVLQS